MKYVEKIKGTISKEKGITLVALVVTIIILLILAGVAINMALGDNGLFKKSKEAVNTWKSAEENESKVLGYLDNEWENLINTGTNQEVEKRYYFKLNGIDCYFTEEESSDGRCEIVDWFEKHVTGAVWLLEGAGSGNIEIDGIAVYSCYINSPINEGEEITINYDTETLRTKIHY